MRGGGKLLSSRQGVSLNHLPADLRSPQDLAPWPRFRAILVAPASSGLSLSRSRWVAIQ